MNDKKPFDFNIVRLFLLQVMLFFAVIVPSFWFFYFIKRLYTNEYCMHTNNDIIFSVNHIGFIMDGNRRWARAEGVSLNRGYYEGVKKLFEMVDLCLKENVKEVTVYGLALANLQQRSRTEINIIFEVAMTALNQKEEWIVNQGIKINIIGDVNELSPQTQEKIEDITKKTENGKVLILNILFGYCPDEDVLYGVKKIHEKVINNELNIEKLTPKMVRNHMRSHTVSDIDLIIRTGGYERLSGFVPIQSAQSEIIIVKDLWPSLKTTYVRSLIRSFHQRKRNLGK